jgi:hypothetical protein
MYGIYTLRYTPRNVVYQFRMYLLVCLYAVIVPFLKN